MRRKGLRAAPVAHLEGHEPVEAPAAEDGDDLLDLAVAADERRVSRAAGHAAVAGVDDAGEALEFRAAVRAQERLLADVGEVRGVEGEADLVLGSRLLDGKALEGGMPLYKYISNRILTTIENLALGLTCSELHTGYRAYSAELLRTIPFMNNSENFVFDTEVIVQTVAFGFRIAEIGVPAKYMDDASSIRFWPSVVYGVQTLWAVARYLGFRLGIPSRIFEGLSPWWKKSTPKRNQQ